MAGSIPPSSPNGYSTFTPELDLSFNTVGATDASTFVIEVEM
jgi:hypothetical protein